MTVWKAKKDINLYFFDKFPIHRLFSKLPQTLPKCILLRIPNLMILFDLISRLFKLEAEIKGIKIGNSSNP